MTDSGRTLVVGDVHGCDVALETMLELLRPTAGDTLIMLGDLVDRGPDSKRVVDQLLDIRQTCQVVYLMGNHEEMMLVALETGQFMNDWLGFGGRETLESYGANPEDIGTEHLAFLASGLPYWETATEIFVHGSLEPGVPLNQQSSHWLRWERITGDEPPHPSGKRVVCGHTAQKSGVPLVFPGWICLDTFVYGDGYLSGWIVETDDLIQVSQHTGEIRQGCKLSELA